MRSLASSLVILLCVSATQAVTYTFDNLVDAGANLNTQVDPVDLIKWQAVTNWSLAFRIDTENAGPPTDLYAHVPNTGGQNRQEQLFTQIAPGNPTGSCLNLPAGLTHFVVSARVRMNNRAGSMIGIWVDGTDGNEKDNWLASVQGMDPNDPNGIETVGYANNMELLCQFGVFNNRWRLRGVNGQYSTYVTDDIPGDGSMPEINLLLEIDLLAHGGDGSMDFYARQVDCGNWIGVIEGQPLGLTGQHPWFADPSKYTGWWIRSLAAYGTSEVTAPGGQTIDDLTLTPNGHVPEPATMSLLVLGGLACLRRRR